MTLHQICVAATERAECTIDGAQAGQPCDRPGGVHLARIITARRDGRVTGEDVVTAIRSASQTPGAVLLDPEAEAA